MTMEVLSQEVREALKVHVVDRYKRSPAFDDVMLRELKRGLCTARMFFGGKEQSPEVARCRWDARIEKYKAESLEAVKNQRMRWRAYCRSIGKEPHIMHLEYPSGSSLITFHASEKTYILNKEVDVGPLPDNDYSSFMTAELDDISWPVFIDLTRGYGDDPLVGFGVGGPSSSSKA